MEYIADDTSRETALEGHLIDAMNAVPYNTIATLNAQGGIKQQARQRRPRSSTRSTSRRSLR